MFFSNAYLFQVVEHECSRDKNFIAMQCMSIASHNHTSAFGNNLNFRVYICTLRILVYTVLTGMVENYYHNLSNISRDINTA